MEITEIIKNSKSRQALVDDHFKANISIGWGDVYYTNYKLSSGKLEFCRLHVLDCRLYSIGNSFMFFLIIKATDTSLANIEQHFGLPRTKTTTSVDNNLIGTSLSWKCNEINLYIHQYFNLHKKPGFDKCIEAIIGNITLVDLTKLDLRKSYHKN